MTISIDKKSLGFKNKNTDQDVLSQEQLSSINSLNPSLRKAKLIGVGGSQIIQTPVL
jgi:hypothetical protein